MNSSSWAVRARFALPVVLAVLGLALPVLLIGTSERSGEVSAGATHDAPPLTPAAAPAESAEPSSDAAQQPPDNSPAEATPEEPAPGEPDVPEPPEVWVDPGTFGLAPPGATQGVLTFRGSPTRSWYGTGPAPQSPIRLWRFPRNENMCSFSSYRGEEIEWCGTGWTGQAAVFERDGRTWVVFGAFDNNVHFLDAATGERLLPDFETGDLIKTSVVIDPDEHPLAYFGSRDNFFRIVAFDRSAPTELWSLGAYDHGPWLWNDDWDSTPLVLDDYLFLGGENSRFFVIRLNRGYGDDGLVTVDPEVVFHWAGWDDQLLADLEESDQGHYNVAIESSPAVWGDTLYFANSGGLVTGWDISGLRDGVMPEQVFRFWAGDDIDATPVVDEEGYLYVGVEYEARETPRAREVGQLVKLDPSRPADPIVWSVHDRSQGATRGVWSTPVVWRDMVYATTHTGRFWGIDRETGEIRWEKLFGDLLWSSPIVVDETLILADGAGRLTAYDVSDTSIEPPVTWQLQVDKEWRFESSPVIWDGVIYVGGRSGAMYAVGDTAAR
ncbi:MAG: PQQ-binding-like beta-propeller repeat protein [Acidimicrobiia bacterium]|nr:PQQ-binding-like beta-propeller repeat protein [Acidimicrobiia bacterium]